MSEKKLTDAQRNIVAALRTGPKYGHELAAPDCGGIGFKERIRELRLKGYNIPHGEYVAPKRFLFRLIEDAATTNRPGEGIASEPRQEPSGCAKGSLSRSAALSPGRSPLAVVDGGNQPPDVAPSPELRAVGTRPAPLPGWPDGEHVLCTFHGCFETWDEKGSSQGCSNGHNACWLEEHHSRATRDARARRFKAEQARRRTAA